MDNNLESHRKQRLPICLFAREVPLASTKWTLFEHEDLRASDVPCPVQRSSWDSSLSAFSRVINDYCSEAFLSLLKPCGQSDVVVESSSRKAQQVERYFRLVIQVRSMKKRSRRTRRLERIRSWKAGKGRSKMTPNFKYQLIDPLSKSFFQFPIIYSVLQIVDHH